MLDDELLKKKTTCRFCEGTNLHLFLDLGFHPHSDDFLKEEKLQEYELFFPLQVYSCLDCGLAQLGHVVSPVYLYQRNYMYESSTTKTQNEHYFSMAKEICKKFNLPKNSFVIDIGSNVGVLLEGFKNQGMKVLGVDPAHNLAAKANERGIETLPVFFNKKTALEILENRGNVKIITGTNVFAHIDDNKGLVEGVEKLLSDDGVFIFELPYLVDLVDNLEYDTIYHQHLSYISVKPLIPFFEKSSMEVFDVLRTSIHGGSIRVFVGHKGFHEIQPVVQELVDLELKTGVYNPDKLDEFAKRVKEQRNNLVSLLIDLKRQGKKIVGISAPAKGNTLLNYCKIDTHYLDYLTEKSTLKVGRYTPGTHIPIYPDEKLLKDNADYAMILAWNFSKEIMNNLQEFKDRGGKFIIPIPEPKIL